jgi:cell division protein FtsQ
VKKVINISLWLIFVLGTIVTLGFVQKEQARRTGSKLEIKVNSTDENYFVTREDIRQILTDRGDTIIHQPLSSINVPDMERVILNNPSVESVDVFVSVNGEVHITASQRKPIARVFNLAGESYYMDQDGKLMPWSASYTADVVAVNGFITESYGNWYRYSVKEIEAMAPLKEFSVLDDIYRIADFINKDEARKAFIGQIYVNSCKEFELVPSFGTFRIILGDASDLEEKFNKLNVFCREGLRNTSAWNEYSVVNLKFKNQIVCTKRL